MNIAKSLKSVVLTAAIAMGSTAFGQILVNSPGAEEIKTSLSDTSSWMYYPGIVDGVVVGFLSCRDPFYAERNDYHAIWYERVAPGVYSAYGWTTGDIYDAAAEVADAFEVPGMFDYANFEAPFPSSPDDTTAGRPLGGSDEMASPCDDTFLSRDVELAQNAAATEYYIFGVISEDSELPAAISCCVPMKATCHTSYYYAGCGPCAWDAVLAACQHSCAQHEVKVCCTGWCGSPPCGPMTDTNLGLVQRPCGPCP